MRARRITRSAAPVVVSVTLEITITGAKRVVRRTTSSLPVATAKVTAKGTFTFRVKRPRSGRYQVVYIPSAGRAERSTSNTGVIR